jgi:hypothetical protein
MRPGGLYQTPYSARLEFSISSMGVEDTMEFNGTQKTTNGGSQPQQAAPRFPSNGGGMGMNKMSMDGGGNKKMWVITAIVVVLLVVGGVCAWMWHSMGSAVSQIKGNEYQALFLTNGQVYFGKLSDVDNKYVKLTDIYYLQVQQTVQPSSGANSNSNPSVSLAKLGSELHGPEDQMEINRSQVLFWENLKDSGKVVQAIHSNQQNK